MDILNSANTTIFPVASGTTLTPEEMSALTQGQQWAGEDLEAFLAYFESVSVTLDEAASEQLTLTELPLTEVEQGGNPLPILQLLAGQILPPAGEGQTQESVQGHVRSTPQVLIQGAEAAPLEMQSAVQGELQVPQILPGLIERQALPVKEDALTQAKSDKPMPQLTEQQLLSLQRAVNAFRSTQQDGQFQSLQPTDKGESAALFRGNLPLRDQNEFLSSLTAVRPVTGKVSAMSVMPELPTVAVSAVDRPGLPVPMPSLLTPQVATSSVQQPLLHGLPALELPMSDKNWGQAMGDRLLWMVRNDVQGAEVKLNPRGLGPIEIRIAIQNDQANVNFIAQHAPTREALENSLPRLREMFMEANLNLADVDVGKRENSTFGGNANTASGDGDTAMADQAGDWFVDEGDEESGVQKRVAGNGILDDYA